MLNAPVRNEGKEMAQINTITSQALFSTLSFDQPQYKLKPFGDELVDCLHRYQIRFRSFTPWHIVSHVQPSVMGTPLPQQSAYTDE
jgi:hypothetical protein